MASTTEEKSGAALHPDIEKIASRRHSVVPDAALLADEGDTELLGKQSKPRSMKRVDMLQQSSDTNKNYDETSP